MQFVAKCGLYSKEIFVKSELPLQYGDYCIVNKNDDLELVKILQEKKDKQKIEGEVLRKASEADLQHFKIINNTIDKKAKFCIELINKYQFPIKLVGIDHSFDGSRFTFYCLNKKSKLFNFKALIKDLGIEFQTRIIFEQIGSREAAKGFCLYGTCGREVCCKKFLKNTKLIPHSIAREQIFCKDLCYKIYGPCNKVKCCYEF